MSQNELHREAIRPYQKQANPFYLSVMGGTGHSGNVPARRAPPHTKFATPRVPVSFVRRPRLRESISKAVSNADVTLLCAPAGYGKTLLLADWIEATGHTDKV